MGNYFIDVYESEKLHAYKCPAGVWTIGKGITVYPNGEPVKEGDIITKQYADVILEDYITKKVMPVIVGMKKNFTQKQKDALVSLIFNIGASAFKRSSLYQAIISDDIKGIFNEWNWISAGGKPLKGLAKRRAEELFWFFEGWK